MLLLKYVTILCSQVLRSQNLYFIILTTTSTLLMRVIYNQLFYKVGSYPLYASRNVFML